MGVLKEKSDQNVASASTLISSDAYSSSVHCSYYSCIQLMLDIFHDHLLIDKKALDTEFGKYKDEADSEIGFHNFYINKIRLEFLQRNKNFEEVQDLYGLLTQLKQKRVDADYTEKIIGKKDSEKALTKARRVIEYLSNTDFKTGKK